VRCGFARLSAKSHPPIKEQAGFAKHHIIAFTNFESRCLEFVRRRLVDSPNRSRHRGATRSTSRPRRVASAHIRLRLTRLYSFKSPKLVRGRATQQSSLADAEHLRSRSILVTPPAAWRFPKVRGVRGLRGNIAFRFARIAACAAKQKTVRQLQKKIISQLNCAGKAVDCPSKSAVLTQKRFDLIVQSDGMREGKTCSTASKYVTGRMSIDSEGCHHHRPASQGMGAALSKPIAIAIGVGRDGTVDQAKPTMTRSVACPANGDRKTGRACDLRGASPE